MQKQQQKEKKSGLLLYFTKIIEFNRPFRPLNLTEEKIKRRCIDNEINNLAKKTPNVVAEIWSKPPSLLARIL